MRFSSIWLNEENTDLKLQHREVKEEDERFKMLSRLS